MLDERDSEVSERARTGRRLAAVWSFSALPLPVLERLNADVLIAERVPEVLHRFAFLYP